MSRFIDVDVWIDKLKRVIKDSPYEYADYCCQLITELEEEFKAQINKGAPCRVGDYVYLLDRQYGKILTRKISQITTVQGRKSLSMQFELEPTGFCMLSDFGRRAFVNKTDAMNALEEKMEVPE